MNKIVYALHTGFVLVEPLRPLFKELLPDVRVVNLVDDGLLAEARAAGGLTPAITRRIAGYGVLAESSGADAILSCCSSVGEAAELMSQMVSIPVVRIDGPMAREAACRGQRIGVLATLPTTLDPTQRLIQREAELAGKAVEFRRYLADGAFDALMSGDAARHDSLVMADIERAASENDVVVLAQGSMARMVPLLPEQLQVRVLSSPHLGIQALKKALGA